jgi:hypothetical protein
MKKIILIVVSLFALSAWAADPVPTFNVTTFKEAKVTPKLLSKKLKRQLKALKQSPELVDSDDYNVPDSEDLDIHCAYANPRVVEPEYAGITDRVVSRLKLARERAVQRHQELWNS